MCFFYARVSEGVCQKRHVEQKASSFSVPSQAWESAPLFSWLWRKEVVKLGGPYQGIQQRWFAFSYTNFSLATDKVCCTWWPFTTKNGPGLIWISFGIFSPFIRPKFGKLHEATCAVRINDTFVHATKKKFFNFFLMEIVSDSVKSLAEALFMWLFDFRRKNVPSRMFSLFPQKIVSMGSREKEPSGAQKEKMVNTCLPSVNVGQNFLLLCAKFPWEFSRTKRICPALFLPSFFFATYFFREFPRDHSTKRKEMTCN